MRTNAGSIVDLTWQPGTRVLVVHWDDNGVPRSRPITESAYRLSDATLQTAHAVATRFSNDHGEVVTGARPTTAVANNEPDLFFGVLTAHAPGRDTTGLW